MKKKHEKNSFLENINILINNYSIKSYLFKKNSFLNKTFNQLIQENEGKITNLIKNQFENIYL